MGGILLCTTYGLLDFFWRPPRPASSFSQEQTAVYLEGLSINGKRDEREFFFTSTFPFGNWILLPPFSVALTQLGTNYG